VGCSARKRKGGTHAGAAAPPARYIWRILEKRKVPSILRIHTIYNKRKNMRVVIQLVDSRSREATQELQKFQSCCGGCLCLGMGFRPPIIAAARAAAGPPIAAYLLAGGVACGSGKGGAGSS
jgi:hypothetical protein